MSTSATTHVAAPANNDASTAVARLHTTWRGFTQVLQRVEPHGQSAVLAALRLLYGWQFVQTGWGKLANLERTSMFFESLGLPNPDFMAAFIGATEFLGGLLLAAGVGTRFAAAVLSSVMVTALLTAHAEDAFVSIEAFTEQAPYPFLVATLILLVFGAGRLSVDGWLRGRKK